MHCARSVAAKNKITEIWICRLFFFCKLFKFWKLIYFIFSFFFLIDGWTQFIVFVIVVLQLFTEANLINKKLKKNFGKSPIIVLYGLTSFRTLQENNDFKRFFSLFIWLNIQNHDLISFSRWLDIYGLINKKI